MKLMPVGCIFYAVMSSSLFRLFLFGDIRFLTTFLQFLPGLCYKSTFLTSGVAADFFNSRIALFMVQ